MGCRIYFFSGLPYIFSQTSSTLGEMIAESSARMNVHIDVTDQGTDTVPLDNCHTKFNDWIGSDPLITTLGRLPK